MEVELVIVRHGETEANKCHIIQGHQDTSLSELGLQQAQCVAKYLGRKYFLILVDALGKPSLKKTIFLLTFVNKDFTPPP